MDLRDEDLGLVEDKFERAMREAHNKYFLLDPKPRRVLLALPPLIPRELLSTFLSVLFNSFQAPSVTLMSSPILSTVAAGLRSALVIDIGWAETTITGVCEFREVHQQRSIRAGRYLSEEMAKMLNSKLARQGTRTPGDDISFEEAEEVLSRVGWCDTLDENTPHDEDEFADALEEPADPPISIPLPLANPPTTLTLPFSALSSPAETALFASGTLPHDFDDHDQPLHILAYRALLSLPIDVRKTCMSRIVITGGASNLPGIKTRLLKEIDKLVQQRGWDSVKSYGSANERHEHLVRERQERLQARASEITKVAGSMDPDSLSASVPAGLAEQELDPIADKLAHLSMKVVPVATAVGGVIRGVESLGAWAGASLIAQMRVKGIVEIERDKFLQHGLQGASREKETSVVPQRQSMGPGVRPGAGDRGSWTLGIWA
jgi:actin-related protein